MNSNKKHINIVWFKRDLRLQDNEAIHNAIQSGQPTLLLYVFEKSLQNDTHYSARHWNFIKQSIVALNAELQPHQTKVLAVNGEVISTINSILELYTIKKVYSHQETGIRITYDRDKAFKRFCKNNQINWVENINNGIFRGLKNRSNWVVQWEKYMNEPQFAFLPNDNNFLELSQIEQLERLLEKKNTDRVETFNLGTGTGSSVLEVIQSFERVSGQKLPYKIVPRREGDVTEAYANTHKANTVLGWKAESTLDEAMASAWKWEQKIRS